MNAAVRPSRNGRECGGAPARAGDGAGAGWKTGERMP